MSAPLSEVDLRARLERSPFARLLGLELCTIDRERRSVVVRLPIRPELERTMGAGHCHGGAVAALIDAAAWYAVAAEGALDAVTMNFRTDFIRAASSPDLFASAMVQHAGRQIQLVDVSVHDAEQRLVALGRASFRTP